MNPRLKILLSFATLVVAFYFSQRFIVPQLFLINPETQTAQTVPAATDIWLEAEYPSAIISPFIQANDPLASNSQYVWTPQNAGNDIGSATYNINISNSGTYYVWGRVFTTSGGSDSFYISVDGGVETIWYTGTSTLWRWDKAPGSYVLSAGTHTLKIRNREDGTELDKILLTSNSALTPSGTGGTAVNIPGTPTPTPTPISFAPLCYVKPAGAATVNNCSALNSALASAAPGSRIVIASGTYSGCAIVSPRSGTSGNPIIIDGASLAGTILDNSTFTISGNYNVVTNITFNNSGVAIYGDSNRVTRNIFQNNAGPLKAAVTVDANTFNSTAQGNRIDHNEVVDYGIGQRGIRILPDYNPTGVTNTAKNNVIDRNYLHRSLGVKTNGADGIQLGEGAADTDEQLNAIVEYNLIEQWEIDGEMISNKSSNNSIRFNTLASSNASGPIRHGKNVDVISNYFFNVRGLVIMGDDHRVIGNTVENGDLVLRNGDITEDQMQGGSGGGHPAARRALVAGNRVINGEICVGCRTPGGNNSSGVPASDNILQGNTGTVTLLAQINTTQSPTYGGTVIPAVRLFPADVGPASADTMCAAPTPIPTPPPAGGPLSGDLNSDRTINSIDFSIMNGKWLTSDATSDLNKDGTVNSLDFSLMNGNWLKTY